MVVFVQSGCIRATVVVIWQSGCIRAKVVVFEQCGCNRKYRWSRVKVDVFEKVVVFGQQWLYRVKLLYSCTSGYIRAKWLCLGKSV